MFMHTESAVVQTTIASVNSRHLYKPGLLISVLMAVPVLYRRYFAILLSVYPILIHRSKGSGIGGTFSLPVNIADTFVSEVSNLASAFSVQSKYIGF